MEPEKETHTNTMSEAVCAAIGPSAPHRPPWGRHARANRLSPPWMMCVRGDPPNPSPFARIASLGATRPRAPGRLGAHAATAWPPAAQSPAATGGQHAYDPCLLLANAPYSGRFSAANPLRSSWPRASLSASIPIPPPSSSTSSPLGNATASSASSPFLS